MTSTIVDPPVTRKRFWHRVKQLTPGQLLLKQYKLTKAQRVQMYIRSTVYGLIAGAVGSAAYFLGIQRAWGFEDPHSTWVTYWGLKDVYDRAPVHLINLWDGFARLIKVPALQYHLVTQTEPGWWVTARHDFRHVLIGLVGTLLVGSLTTGLGKKTRQRISNRQIIFRYVAAIPVALICAAPFIFLFAYLFPEVMHVGFGGGSGFVEQWIGKGTWQLTLIGVAAGVGAKLLVLKPAEDSLQLISLEKHMLDQAEPKWWWNIVYSESYRNRYAYLRASGHKPERHGQFMGFLIMQGSVIFLALLGFGIWLDYFSGMLPK